MRRTRTWLTGAVLFIVISAVFAWFDLAWAAAVMGFVAGTYAGALGIANE